MNKWFGFRFSVLEMGNKINFRSLEKATHCNGICYVDMPHHCLYPLDCRRKVDKNSIWLLSGFVFPHFHHFGFCECVSVYVCLTLCHKLLTHTLLTQWDITSVHKININVFPLRMWERFSLFSPAWYNPVSFDPWFDWCVCCYPLADCMLAWIDFTVVN